MKLDLNDPTAVLLAVHRSLRAAGIGAATYGGLALAAYGVPRETKDADLAVAGAEAARVLAALRAAGFDAAIAFENVQFGGNRVTRFTLLPNADHAGLNTADLVEPRAPWLATKVLERAIVGTLRGEDVRLVSPEDFVLLKVLSTRDRDAEDAASVVASLGARIDLAAIERDAQSLARELPDHDVAGRLRRVLAAPQ